MERVATLRDRPANRYKIQASRRERSCHPGDGGPYNQRVHTTRANKGVELPGGMHGSLAGNIARLAHYLQRLPGGRVRGRGTQRAYRGRGKDLSAPGERGDGRRHESDKYQFLPPTCHPGRLRLRGRGTGSPGRCSTTRRRRALPHGPGNGRYPPDRLHRAGERYDPTRAGKRDRVFLPYTLQQGRIQDILAGACHPATKYRFIYSEQRWKRSPTLLPRRMGRVALRLAERRRADGNGEIRRETVRARPVHRGTTGL